MVGMPLALPSPNRPWYAQFAVVPLVVALSACGGGGGGGESVATPSIPQTPANGPYSYALKNSGSASAPTIALSVVHPAAAGTEFEIESSFSPVQDVVEVNSATFDAGSKTFRNATPFALFYISSNDVRWLPMVADGTNPRRQQSLGGTTYCKVKIQAINHAAPLLSRFIVSTKGTDGRCDTFDDGEAEISITTTGKPVLLATSTAQTLGMLRTSDTHVPAAWVTKTQIKNWNGAAITMPAAAQSVVSQAPDAVLVDQVTQMSVWTLAGNETRLPSNLTSGGYKEAGFDALNFYVYRSSSGSPANWTMLRVSRSAPAASVVATGAGTMSSAAVGRDVIYGSVSGLVLPAVGNTASSLGSGLYRMPKSGASAAQLLETGSSSSLISVLTSSSAVHLLWRVSNIATSSQSLTVELVDEAGSKLYVAAGGFPLGVSSPRDFNLNQGENRARFLFASGYGTNGFNGASLYAYESSTRAVTSLGALPLMRLTFSADMVAANISLQPTDFLGVYAAPVSQNSTPLSSGQVFTVNTTVPNSLAAANRKQ